LYNLAPFGLCKSPANPAVAAATAAAGGKLQEMPCLPAVFSPWVNGKPTVFVKGAPALIDPGKCVCTWAGVIDIADPGQKSVDCAVAPPLAEPEVPEPTPEVLAKAAALAESAGGTAAPKTKPGYVQAQKKGIIATITATIGSIFGMRGKAGDAEAPEPALATKTRPASTSSKEARPEESAPGTIKPGTCYCNCDIDVDTFKEIIKCLRAMDPALGDGLFFHKNCPLPKEDKTIERLTEEFNKACREYDINTCIQKIHFLSQIYWESDHFKTTLEYASGEAYNPGKHSDAERMGHIADGDGPKYKGRGLMQLTWRENQLNYLIYARNKFEKLKGQSDADIKDRDNNFERLISDTLSGGMDSAGWYWSVGKTVAFAKKAYKEQFREITGLKLNAAALFADKYQEGISITINGGGNGKAERKRYYDAIKTIINVGGCVNKEKYKGTLSGV
jgi:predicted chitinase